MRLKPIIIVRFVLLLTCFLTTSSYAARNVNQFKIRNVVDHIIRPLMQKYTIPGMAVAVTFKGQSYIYNYGVASKRTRQPVTINTLFEIGSLSKTFTATLASYAQINGNLKFSNRASKYLPSLRGSSFDNISLLNLGTYTSGGLPLQVPDAIGNNDQLMDYFKHWQPAYAAGTHRLYSNPSIGLLGMIAAMSMHENFDDAIEKKLLPELGMTHSYIHVPIGQMKNYAQGYTGEDAPIRMRAGVLASEAYGMKTSAADMIRFIEANMQEIKLDGKLQRAITNTHMAYFRVGEMTQDLTWEQFPYPVGLKRVLNGNSQAMIYEATRVTPLNPSLTPQANVLINKTGSTNGFAAYTAFIPAKKIGIVLLANKSCPTGSSVTAAYQILTKLARTP